jgi:hypothetical protein
MAAEVDHGRLQLAELVEEIQRSRCPARLQLQPVSVATPFKSDPDRSGFLVQRERVGSDRVCG